MIPKRATLLLTRPQPASQAFLDGLPAELRGRLRVVISPLIGFDVTGPLPDLSRYGGLIFTSANAVRAFGALGGSGHLPAFAVGPATAAAARTAGFDPVTGPGDAAGLIDLIADRAPTPPLLHLRGTHSRGDVAVSLTARGIATDEAMVYDQPARPLSDTGRAALDREEPVILPLFSPRTARQFAREWAAGTRRAALHVAVMSPSVADALDGVEAAVLRVAERPTAQEMCNEVVTLGNSPRLLEGGKGAQ